MSPSPDLPLAAARVAPFLVLASVALLGGGCVERLIYEDLKGEEAIDVDHNIDVEVDECAVDNECGDNEACFEGVCVGRGIQRFSLSWTADTDFDLHVVSPVGDHIHFALPFTAYAHLDVDDCVDSVCNDPDGVHVENVFFEGEPPRGEYTVWVENFNGAAAGDYQIELVGEINERLAGRLPAVESSSGPHHNVTW